jgi:dsRNA-specific ribonuclease
MPSLSFLDRLGHAFRRPELIARALTHRSHGATHNERLEFVGDAVLNCAVAAVLFERFPAIPEGELSRVRASLVNRDTLARLAREFALGGEIAWVKARSGGGTSGRRFSPMRSRRCSAPFSSTPASTPHAA